MMYFCLVVCNNEVTRSADISKETANIHDDDTNIDRGKISDDVIQNEDTQEDDRHVVENDKTVQKLSMRLRM